MQTFKNSNNSAPKQEKAVAAKPKSANTQAEKDTKVPKADKNVQKDNKSKQVRFCTRKCVCCILVS